MSINLEFYNKCNECKHLKESLYMELEDGQKLYNYWCDFNNHRGEIKCNKFEKHDKL